MRFTLTYEGSLPSQGKAAIKHDIRCALHPQIKALWGYLPLKDNADWLTPSTSSGDSSFLTPVGGHLFASVVHPSHHLFAELDILLLKPEASGAIITNAGDIDNRLKTLFDALRTPSLEQEIPSSWNPAPDEQPLHCLLQDDRLISRVNVEADRLLVPLAQPDDVKLTIRVTVKAHTATWGNIGLIA
jgi:hypothetical protein